MAARELAFIVGGLLAMSSLIGLAVFFLWRRPHRDKAAPPRDGRHVTPNMQAQEEKTEFIPRPPMLPSAPPYGRIEFIPRAETNHAVEQSERTEFIPFERGRAPTYASPEPTAHIPREEIFARMRGPSGVELRAAPRVAESATEFIPKDQLFAKLSPPPPTIEHHVAVASVISAPPAPASPPGPATPTYIDIPEQDLRAQFEGGARALVSYLDTIEHAYCDLKVLGEGPLRKWQEATEILALVAQRSFDELLLPAITARESPPSLRTAAALTGLELHKKVNKGPTRILEAADGLDDAGHAAIVRAVGLWDDPGAEKLVRKAIERSQGTRQLEWLHLLADLGIDPGAELVAQCLRANSPALLIAAIRLLPYFAKGAAEAAKLDRHLFDIKQPELRQAAVETGLFFRRQSAWLICGQLSRDPQYPRACELMALLGTAAEAESLVAWARESTAPAHAAWSMGLTGRVAGIEGCLARMVEGDAAVVEAALAGFDAATGFAGEPGRPEVAAARAWWGEHRGRFQANRRYLAGEEYELGRVVARLQRGPARHREVLALELELRSAGRVRVRSRALEWVQRAQLGRVAEAKVEFQSGFHESQDRRS